MISSFILLYSFNTLFIKTNSSFFIFKSIEALEIKIFLLFNLDFANITTSLCFFFFFLIIDLYFLIPGVIAQIYNSITDLEIPIGIPSKEGNAEIEMHLVAAETKIRKCSIFQIWPNLFILLPH